jgi:hypothetical protein
MSTITDDTHASQQHNCPWQGPIASTLYTTTSMPHSTQSQSPTVVRRARTLMLIGDSVAAAAALSTASHPGYDASHDGHSCSHHVPDLVQHEGVSTHLQAQAGDATCRAEVPTPTTFSDVCSNPLKVRLPAAQCLQPTYSLKTALSSVHDVQTRLVASGRAGPGTSHRQYCAEYCADLARGAWGRQL